ncbi:MAG TPA: hypothetical protein VKV80_08310 [Streptosporangiaceae bacterium]|nr:hypothetical protein [Streptosporangiaceae bacterium]
MKPKQLLGWAIVAFIIFYIIKAPAAAAHGVHDIGNFLDAVGTGFSHFFSAL